MKLGLSACAGLIGALLAVPAGAAEIVDHGLRMPLGAQQVGESRYRVTSNYDETIKFFRYHKSYKRTEIISQPGIRAINLQNDGPGDWDSINIYEKDGEVRVFVIPRTAPPKKERRKEKQ